MRAVIVVTAAVLIAGVVVAVAPVRARQRHGERRSVAEQVLEILRRQGQIDQKTYERLRRQAEQERKRAEGAFRVYWKEGLHFDSRDGRFRLKLGGRLQADWAVLASGTLEDDFPALAGVESGAEVRRGRIYVAGILYDLVDFKTQYDFATGDVKLKDFWLGLRDVPIVGHVKVGHFKEPFSLEELASSKHITFMERSLASVFAPSRNMGIGLGRTAASERITWAAGAFRETDSSGTGFGPGSEYNISARVTGLPFYAEGGRKLLHLGLSYSHKFRSRDAIGFGERPEAHLSPVDFVDTGSLLSDGVDLVDPEIALVWGPLSFQSEYIHALVARSNGADLGFGGFYVYASCFLTGEHRPYKRAHAAFGNVHPTRNFDPRAGRWGAWEAGVRYSRLDLNGGGARGGRLDDVTAGLNWYLNPSVRITVNYVHAHRSPFGDADIAEGRFQVVF